MRFVPEMGDQKVSQTMKQFEELPVSQIPWGHNVILVTKIKDTKERLWCAHMPLEEGWTREALEDAIVSKFFHLFQMENLKNRIFGKLSAGLRRMDE